MEKKHLTRFFMLAVAAGTLFGACQKEDLAAVEDDFDMTGRIRLYAEKTSSASGAKLVADDTENLHKFKWYDGDQIKINGIANNVTVDHSSFAADALNDAPNDIIAVYPASICEDNTFSNAGSGSGSITVTIPHEIEYREGGIEVPMMAYASKEDALENGLSFKHLASVLAVRVSNGTTNNIKMGSIEVSLGSGNYPIAGTWTVTYSGTGDGLIVTNDPKNGTFDGYSNKITMTFPTDNPCVISSSESKYFFFPIFSILEAGGSFSSAKFTIKVRATDTQGNACNFEKTQANNTKAIGRGEIAYAPVAMDASTNSHAFDLGDGLYEIASGNLAYNITTREWSFLPYNVATVEDDSWVDNGRGEHQGVLYDGKLLMSCFLYGYAAEDCTYLGSYYEEGFAIPRPITSGNLSGSTDWGFQVSSYLGDGWTTPTSAQWEALFSDDKNYYLYDPENDNKYKLPGLNSKGYIVVPDLNDFAEALRADGLPDLQVTTGQKLDKLFEPNDQLEVNNKDFDYLAAHGAIFIPVDVKNINSDDSGNYIDSRNKLYSAKDHAHFAISTRTTDRESLSLDEGGIYSAPVRLIRKVSAN